MTASNSVSNEELLAAIHELRGVMQQLHARVDALEQRMPEPRLSDDIVCIISATVAAYLGVKPRIRQIRLVGNPHWAQEGRASIQASHGLTRRTTRSKP